MNHNAILAGVPLVEDVVDFTLRCAIAIGHMDDRTRQIVDRHVRSVFGRSRVYIASRADELAKARNAVIKRDYQRGERVELLSRRYELSTVQIWRIINDVPNH